MDETGEAQHKDGGQRSVYRQHVAPVGGQYEWRHDPGPVLERVRCPVLALNGTLDIQVPCEVNLSTIEAALERGENPDHEVRAFETLNHLFQHCDTGQVKEYGQIEETFSPEVLGVLNDWITQRFVTER